MEPLLAIFQNHIYSLWLGQWKRNKPKLWLWARTDEAGKPANPVVVCFREHPVYVNEFEECTQRPCTMVYPSEVSLIRLADADDYENHLIIIDNYVNKQLKENGKDN